MSLFTRREGRLPHRISGETQAHQAESHREPSRPIDDEMRLFGFGSDHDDELLWLALTSKPEHYYSSDRRDPHHEVL